MSTVDLRTLDDEQLMVLVQDDEPEAFGVLYRRHEAHALRAAATVSQERAAEAVQDGFISVWSSRAQYHACRTSSVHAWIITIVRRRALDLARRDLRRGPVATDEACGSIVAPGSLEDDSISRGEGDRLRAAIRRLPEMQREVVVLAYFGGLTLGQIASRLALPEGTVKGRMRLGLDKLRAQSHEAAGGGPGHEW